MKTPIFKSTAMLMAFAIMLFLAACEKTEHELPTPASKTAFDQSSPDKLNSNTVSERASQNAVMFPPNANMFGQSYAEWSEDWWQWMFSAEDCPSIPNSDPDGSLGYQNQSGPVFYLAGTWGGSASRSITIPQGKAVLFPLINGLFIGNCPGYYPEPGQTLEEYYQSFLEPFVDMADGLSVTLDGQTYTDLEDYRAASYLFNMTGNAELACFDSCITGAPQEVGSDGIWVMLKPLSPGTHTLTFTG
ncbi:MAG: hypothetical protein IT258_15145, partial [Saprospiraceae bacterium]|nr:hypothetical protein [Saprospiraceae bacterium]